MASVDNGLRPPSLVSSDEPRAMSRWLESEERRDLLYSLLLILPALAIVFLVIAYPLFYSLWISANDVDFVKQKWTFVGLKNYLDILPKPDFQMAAVRTFYYTALSVAGSVGIGLLMALALNENFRGRSIMRSVVLVPWATSGVVIGIIWKWIYDGQTGVLNGVLYALGIVPEYVPWMSEGVRALTLTAIAHIWAAAPGSSLLLLAGLQAIPPNLYNASKIDGANAWQRFWRVTLPWLRPMLLLAVILSTIGGLMTFDLIYVMTRGGPGSATTVFSWLGYTTTYQFFRFGEGTAILYVLTLACLVLAYFYVKLLHREQMY